MKNKNIKQIFPTVGLLLLGVILLLGGAIMGGADGVWEKAARICLECIGIG